MLGTNIRMGLAKVDMTMEQLAGEIGKTRKTVSNWCNNHTTPEHKDQLAMCEVFNVDLIKFLEWHK